MYEKVKKIIFSLHHINYYNIFSTSLQTKMRISNILSGDCYAYWHTYLLPFNIAASISLVESCVFIPCLSQLASSQGAFY